MRTIQTQDSRQKPNAVVVPHGLYEYMVCDNWLCMTPVESVAGDDWIRIEAPGMYLVYGTSQESLTVEQVK